MNAVSKAAFAVLMLGMSTLTFGLGGSSVIQGVEAQVVGNIDNSTALNNQLINGDFEGSTGATVSDGALIDLAPGGSMAVNLAAGGATGSENLVGLVELAVDDEVLLADVEALALDFASNLDTTLPYDPAYHLVFFLNLDEDGDGLRDSCLFESALPAVAVGIPNTQSQWLPRAWTPATLMTAGDASCNGVNENQGLLAAYQSDGNDTFPPGTEILSVSIQLFGYGNLDQADPLTEFDDLRVWASEEVWVDNVVLTAVDPVTAISGCIDGGTPDTDSCEALIDGPPAAGPTPDPDADGDGVPDAADQCDDSEEAITGSGVYLVGEDGCPLGAPVDAVGPVNETLVASDLEECTVPDNLTADMGAACTDAVSDGPSNLVLSVLCSIDLLDFLLLESACDGVDHAEVETISGIIAALNTTTEPATTQEGALVFQYLSNPFDETTDELGLNENANGDDNSLVYTVALTTQPLGPVTVQIAVTDSDGDITLETANGNGDTVTLDFTPLNYADFQTVTVSGDEDGIIDGPATETFLLVHSFTSAPLDDELNTKPDQTVTAKIQDMDIPFFGLTCDPTAPDLQENDTSKKSTCTVSVGANEGKPIVATVHFNVSRAQVEGGATPILFTQGNYGSKTFTVIGKDDALYNLDETVNITVKGSSQDLAYNSGSLGAQPDPYVHVEVLDDEMPKVILTSIDDEAAEAGGDSASYKLALEYTPRLTDDVVITATGDSQVGTITPSVITLNATNDEQIITVTAEDDAVVEGAHTANVTHVVTAGNVEGASSLGKFEFNIVDDDLVGILLQDAIAPHPFGPVDEGDAFNVTVELTSEPTGTVCVEIDAINASLDSAFSAGFGTCEGIEFDASNWNETVQLPFTADENLYLDGDHLASITASVNATISTAAEYKPSGSTVTDSHDVTILDDDEAGFTLTNTSGEPDHNVTVDEESTKGANFTIAMNTSAGTSSMNEVGVYLTGDELGAEYDILIDGVSVVQGTVPNAYVFIEFNVTNWQGIEFQVLAHDDLDVEGTQSYALDLEVNSVFMHDINNPSHPDVVQPNDVTVYVVSSSTYEPTTHIVIKDNEIAAVNITNEQGLEDIAEGAAQDGSFQLNLTKHPGGLADVEVTLEASEGLLLNTTGSGAPADELTIVIPVADWADLITVNVTSIDNDVDQGATYSGAIEVTTTRTGGVNIDNPEVGTPSDLELTIIDDDTAGYNVVAVSDINVTEGGTSGAETATFHVVLTSEPTDTVVLDLGHADGQFNLDVSQLTFGAGNWSDGSQHEVTATVVDDNFVEGLHAGLVSFTHNTTGTQAAEYAGPFTVSDLSIAVNDNDDPGLIVTEPVTFLVKEGDGPSTVELTLAAQPLEPVTVGFTVEAGPGQVTVDMDNVTSGVQTTIVIQPANWNTPHGVDIQAVDDDLDADSDTDEAVLNFTTASDDSDFNGLYEELDVPIQDNDVGVKISQTAVSIDEGGASVTYEVSLTDDLDFSNDYVVVEVFVNASAQLAQPHGLDADPDATATKCGGLRVDATSGNFNENTCKLFLVFTPGYEVEGAGNGKVAQTVTITAPDDDHIDWLDAILGLDVGAPEGDPPSPTEGDGPNLNLAAELREWLGLDADPTELLQFGDRTITIEHNPFSADPDFQTSEAKAELTVTRKDTGGTMAPLEEIGAILAVAEGESLDISNVLQIAADATCGLPIPAKVCSSGDDYVLVAAGSSTILPKEVP